jgi:spore coat protein A, manganese oxidase
MPALDRWKVFLLFTLLSFFPAAAGANQQVVQVRLPGSSIPKFVEPVPLFGPAGIQRVASSRISVSFDEFQQKVLPSSIYARLPSPFNSGTFLWGYNVERKGPRYPGVTIEARRDVPTTVTFTNRLEGPGGMPSVLQKFLTVDQMMDWADPENRMCMFRRVSCAATSVDPCCKPYGYPLWRGRPLPFMQIPVQGEPIPAVPHLHGGETPSAFDGGPEQWFTASGEHGPGYVSLSETNANSVVYRYPNSQEAATLWLHDHALGTTRVNVYAGLAAFYLLRDERDTGFVTNPVGLPAGRQEVELIMQDRMFDTNGQLLFPDAGMNPGVHPFWYPEFFGDTIVVNGKSWPYMEVEPKRYRLRLLNGSNDRFFGITFRNQLSNNTLPFWQIGTDGGLLDSPVQLNQLLLAPGERGDVIVDFARVPAGSRIIMSNNAPAPYPAGVQPDLQTTGQIIQFRVGSPVGADWSCNPYLKFPNLGACNLRGDRRIVRLADPNAGCASDGVSIDVKRQLVLREVPGSRGPMEVLLNNTKWSGLKESTMTRVILDPLLNPFPGTNAVPITCRMEERTEVPCPRIGENWVSELPQIGSTELWEILNTTMDAHPLHIHLVQFQVMNRQRLQVTPYLKTLRGLPGDGPTTPYEIENEDGALGGNPAFRRFLLGLPLPPKPSEAGWKDTAVANPGEVLRLLVRWAPQRHPVDSVSAGDNLFPFDPTASLSMFDSQGYPGGPGYMWHCHNLDHEDNEMMRPFMIVP